MNRPVKISSKWLRCWSFNNNVDMMRNSLVLLCSRQRNGSDHRFKTNFLANRCFMLAFPTSRFGKPLS